MTISYIMAFTSHMSFKKAGSPVCVDNPASALVPFGLWLCQHCEAGPLVPLPLKSVVAGNLR